LTLSPVEHLRSLLGTKGVQDAPQVLDAHALGGVRPAVVVQPSLPEHVTGVLALAAQQGWGVIPWGGGFQQGCGNIPARYTVALRLTGLASVLDHDADNLTLTAQAGLTLAAANQTLARNHQRLCLGPPTAPNTLGGLLSAAPVNPRRLVQGDVRDQVLALCVALPDGTLVRYGRKVIKNVAGYDMNRLFVGSRGLLGVVVEATFKLFALPDEEGAILGAFADLDAAVTCASAFYGSRLLPASLFLVDSRAAGTVYGSLQRTVPGKSPHAWHLLAAFEGRAATLRRQLSEGEHLMRNHGAQTVSPGSGLPPALGEALSAPEGGLPADVPYLKLRIGLLPVALSSVLRDLESTPTLRDAVRCVDYGAGQVLLSLPVHPADTESLAALISQWRKRLAADRGFLVVERVPDFLRNALSAWGDLEGEASLMRLFKQQFDPCQVLSPGRYLENPA